MKLQQLSLSDLYRLKESLISRLAITLKDVASLIQFPIDSFDNKDFDFTFFSEYGDEINMENRVAMTLKYCLNEITSREEAIIKEIGEAPLKKEIIDKIIQLVPESEIKGSGYTKESLIKAFKGEEIPTLEKKLEETVRMFAQSNLGGM